MAHGKASHPIIPSASAVARPTPLRLIFGFGIFDFGIQLFIVSLCRKNERSH